MNKASLSTQRRAGKGSEHCPLSFSKSPCAGGIECSFVYIRILQVNINIASRSTVTFLSDIARDLRSFFVITCMCLQCTRKFGWQGRRLKTRERFVVSLFFIHFLSLKTLATIHTPFQDPTDARPRRPPQRYDGGRRGGGRSDRCGGCGHGGRRR